LGIARVGNRFLLLCVEQTNVTKHAATVVGAAQSERVANYRTTLTTHALGMSRTKIHLTLKIPFHLSCAHTVEVLL
jgi:hypothetical protein